jgi:AcrR family transcriptional regulator
MGALAIGENPDRSATTHQSRNPEGLVTVAGHDRRGKRSGRRPGSSGTREAILAAASRQFAANGYDRTALRAVAAEAGVDQKLVAYFFGSKQGLFVAAVGLPFNPADALRSILDGDPDALDERIAAVVTEILEQPALHQRLTGVIRASASEPTVARMMREFLTREVFAPVAEILGTDDAEFRLNLVGSQIVGLILARYVAGLEPLASLAPKAVANAVAPTLRRYLVEPLGVDTPD